VIREGRTGKLSKDGGKVATGRGAFVFGEGKIGGDHRSMIAAADESEVDNFSWAVVVTWGGELVADFCWKCATNVDVRGCG
jgi:hypothetical protein